MRQIFLPFCFFLGLCFAQAQRISDHNSIGWYTATISPKISEKWAGHIEYQWRRNDIITQWQQSLLRLGMTYKLHPQVSAQIGYGWIRTFDYGDISLTAAGRTFDEHRIYEQLVANSSYGKVRLSHRLRLEQRWLASYTAKEDPKPQKWNYLNRIRYMPRVDVPIGTKGTYAAAYDEIFIGFGGNIEQNIFDQNRIGILLGYQLNSKVRLEGGFLNQTVQLGRRIDNQNAFQYNNGIILNTYFAL